MQVKIVVNINNINLDIKLMLNPNWFNYQDCKLTIMNDKIIRLTNSFTIKCGSIT